MEFQQLIPQRSDRALLVGQTGSGKTTLAERLCVYRKFVVVYDTKGRLNWRAYKLVQSLSILESLEPIENERIVYRPAFDELQNQDAIEGFFEWVYLRGNTTLYVDEALSVSTSFSIPKFYLACLTRGRELGIEVWSSTQRPSGLHQTILSEAEHYYTFKLQLVPDSKKIEMMTGIDQELIRRLRKREFVYYNHDIVTRPLTLKLGGKNDA